MALNIDVAPTLLELAGAPVPETMQGRSLAPLLRGRATDWRDSFLYEYFQEDWLPGLPDMLGVRTASWKYITYPTLPGEMEELYHLDADPHELRNLAADAAHTEKLREMRAELERLKRETKFGESLPPRVHTAFAPVFRFVFAGPENGRLRDRSGNGHSLSLPDQAWEETGMGMRFTGDGYATLAPGPGGLPNPAMKAFTVRAEVVPEAESGAIVSLGGETHGFVLGLRDGRPCFALRSAGNYGAVVADAPAPPATPVRLAAVLTDTGDMRLHVDGRRAAEAEGPGFIPARPNDSYAIGADPNSPVFAPEGLPKWRGILREVRFDWGAPPELGGRSHREQDGRG